MQPITVLSLFDGMSCGRLALERAGIPVASYYASEIDKYAIQVSKKNYPSIIHIGDVSKCEYRHMSGSKKHQGSVITQSYILCNINPSGNGQNGNVYSSEGKSPTLTTNKGEGPKILQLPRGANKGGIFEQKTPTLSSNSRQYNNLLHNGYCLRRLTPIECERLQTLPDNYTEGVSNSQRYKMLGNGWTVDVIAHIFREMFRG